MPGKFNNLLWLVLPATMVISGLAWTNHVYQRSDYHFADDQGDTIPKKSKPYSREKKGDIDEQIQQLEKAMQQLDQTIEKKDWEKMQRELEESLSKIDVKEMQEKIEGSLKEIDAEKIKTEIDKAMKEVDMKKMDRELEMELKNSQKYINREEINRQIEKAMRETHKDFEELKKINFDEIEAEIEAAHESLSSDKLRINEEIEKARKEIDLSKMNIREELNAAKEEIKKTKTQMENYRKMITEMDKDGLLKSKENYSIQYKDGGLIINGKQQPKQVVDKYKSYFPMEGVTLKRELDGQFEVNK